MYNMVWEFALLDDGCWDQKGMAESVLAQWIPICFCLGRMAGESKAFNVASWCDIGLEEINANTCSLRYVRESFQLD